MANEQSIFDRDPTSLDEIKIQRKALNKKLEILEAQEKQIAQRAYFDVYNMMTANAISSSAMIAFLQEAGKNEGVIVKYPYKNAQGADKLFTYKLGQKGPNPLVTAIRTGELLKDRAMGYAVDPTGAVYITKLFEPKPPEVQKVAKALKAQ